MDLFGPSYVILPTTKVRFQIEKLLGYWQNVPNVTFWIEKIHLFDINRMLSLFWKSSREMWSIAFIHERTCVCKILRE